MNVEIQMIAILTSISCAIPGVYLVLRGMSMMADSISHTVLLGIVVSYMITKDLNSVWLMIGATIVGVITVWLTELISRVKLIRSDTAIGLVFPFLFSVAIIIITKFASSVHLDVDAVMLGELAFAPFDRMIVNGVDIGAKGIYVSSIMLLLNVLFVVVFNKEMNISVFDKKFAITMGITPVMIYYLHITLVSLTTVSSFNIMGSVLVLAFMVIPANTAYLFSKSVKEMMYLSVLFSIVSTVLGYRLAIILDVSIAGMMALISGIIFLCMLVYTKIKRKVN